MQFSPSQCDSAKASPHFLCLYHWPGCSLVFATSAETHAVQHESKDNSVSIFPPHPTQSSHSHCCPYSQLQSSSVHTSQQALLLAHVRSSAAAYQCSDFSRAAGRALGTGQRTRSRRCSHAGGAAQLLCTLQAFCPSLTFISPLLLSPSSLHADAG